MRRSGKSASDIAREIWGSTTDRRGYSVGRNRDRIGHYLNATSYPEPDNLEKLAKAVGVPVSDLTIDRPAANPGPRSRPAPASLTLTTVAPGKMRIQVDKTVDSAFALRLAALIEACDTPDLNVADLTNVIDVMNGNKNGDEPTAVSN